MSRPIGHYAYPPRPDDIRVKHEEVRSKSDLLHAEIKEDERRLAVLRLYMRRIRGEAWLTGAGNARIAPAEERCAVNSNVGNVDMTRAMEKTMQREKNYCAMKRAKSRKYQAACESIYEEDSTSEYDDDDDDELVSLSASPKSVPSSSSAEKYMSGANGRDSSPTFPYEDGEISERKKKDSVGEDLVEPKVEAFGLQKSFSNVMSRGRPNREHRVGRVVLGLPMEDVRNKRV